MRVKLGTINKWLRKLFGIVLVVSWGDDSPTEFFLDWAKNHPYRSR